MRNLMKLSLWGNLCHRNLARELYDKELSLIIPINTLNQNITHLLNNKGLNHHEQHILEILRMNLRQAMRIVLPKNKKYMYC